MGTNYVVGNKYIIEISVQSQGSKRSFSGAEILEYKVFYGQYYVYLVEATSSTIAWTGGTSNWVTATNHTIAEIPQ